MSKKVLVTGINGFVGHHVATQLKTRGIFVIGAGNQPTVQDDLELVIDSYISCDLTNKQDVNNIDLKDVNAIINLAGFAKVGDSIGQGELYDKVNIGVHTVLYQECLNQRVSPRIIAVSTGAVYDSTKQMPITEESPLVPDDRTNEYVLSKKKMEEAVLKFRDSGLDCIVVRPFNHTGPGQLPGFLLPDLYEQIKKADATDSPMMVGNLDTKRDFTDVRDVARAYIDLALTDKINSGSGIYNICSGKSTSGREVLNILADACSLNNLRLETDPAKIRPNEVMDIYGSNKKINEDTGWQPEIKLEETIKDFVRSVR